MNMRSDMTLRQAIIAAKSISVHATDVIDLNINKRQAHEVRKTRDWIHRDLYDGGDICTWNLQECDQHLFLLIPC